MISKQALFTKKSRQWDSGARKRSKFSEFERTYKAFQQALRDEKFDDAKVLSGACCAIDISDFRVHEIEIYNRVISKVENYRRTSTVSVKA